MADDPLPLSPQKIKAPAVDSAQAFAPAILVQGFRARPNQGADLVVDQPMGFTGRSRRHASSMLDVLTGQPVVV
jgi:hypothetical protein